MSKKHFVIVRPAAMPVESYNSKRIPMPLGPLYLAEELLALGYDVSIVDNITIKQISELIDVIREDTVAVGISTMSGTQLLNAMSIARHLRIILPNLPLIWGGVHVTHLPEQSLRSDLIDYIVWGEGEQVLPKLLSIISEGFEIKQPIPGMGYRDKFGSPVLGERSGFTPLDRVFHLPYHLLDMDNYARELEIGARKEFYIWTSRGCPFRCNFCSNSSSVWPNTQVRYHSIGSIVNDVRTLCDKYDADMITFADENFILREDRLVLILEALHGAGIKCKYKFAARIDQLLKLSESTFELMKMRGVVAIGFAPESGSQRILDDMHKKITVEQVYEVNHLLTKYGFYKSMNFLAATPSETRADLNLTLEMICRLAESSKYCPWPFGLHKYIPLPGTKMFEDAIAHGFTQPETFEAWTTFDFSGMSETRESTRPWINETDYEYLMRAITLTEELNYLFTGRTADSAAIDCKINEIKDFMRSPRLR